MGPAAPRKPHNSVGSKMGYLSDYYESEMERWEQTKELGPWGTFKRDFAFGVTGPAPTIRHDESRDFYVDHGPEPFRSVNRASFELQDRTLETAKEAADNAIDLGVPSWLKWAVPGTLILVAIMAFSYTVGQLFEIEI